jgi:hypothetical protein
MEFAPLFLSLVFGLVGMGMFMYGKSQHKYIHLGSGALLMVVPYFIPQAVVLMIVCSVITAAPFVVARG